MENRLRPKYLVFKVNPDNNYDFQEAMKSTDPEDINSPFVLMPRKDPAAFAALIVYMKVCEPRLANEIRAWLNKVANAPVICGTQGERNFMAVRNLALLDVL